MLSINSTRFMEETGEPSVPGGEEGCLSGGRRFGVGWATVR